MLNSGEIKYSNPCDVRKKNSERNKNHTPPLFKLNGRPLTTSHAIKNFLGEC